MELIRSDPRACGRLRLGAQPGGAWRGHTASRIRECDCACCGTASGRAGNITEPWYEAYRRHTITKKLACATPPHQPGDPGLLSNMTCQGRRVTILGTPADRSIWLPNTVMLSSSHLSMLPGKLPVSRPAAGGVARSYLISVMIRYRHRI